jgi:hypothetical protein
MGGLSGAVLNVTILGGIMQLHVRHREDRGSDSLSARAWAWMHQLELDGDLAGGVDPASSPALLTRARQLQAIHCRQHLVAQIDAAMAKAEHPPHWHSARIPVRAVDVRAARDALGALRRALTTCETPCVRGLALASCLLNDFQGPLYRSCARGDVAQLADEATGVLAADQHHRAGSVGSG